MKWIKLILHSLFGWRIDKPDVVVTVVASYHLNVNLSGVPGGEIQKFEVHKPVGSVLHSHVFCVHDGGFCNDR